MVREACYKITEDCPCRCTFCDSYIKYNEVLKKQVISYEEWKSISDKLIGQGLQSVVISGGEPLLRPDVTLKLIKYLKANNVYVVLNTSAVLFRKGNYVLLEEVIKAAPNLIVFSVDSSEAEKHDENRNRHGLYEQVIESIKYLKSNSDVSVGIRTVITRNNYKELPEIIEIFGNLNVDCIKLTHIENDVEDEYVLHEKDLVYFNECTKKDMIQKIRYLNTSQQLQLENEKSINSILADMNLFASISKGMFSPTYIGNTQCCLQGRFFSIQSNGDVLPCCEAEHHYYPVLGNLLRDSVNDIIDSDDFNRFLNHRLDYCSRCTQMQNFQLSFKKSTKIVERR